MKKAYFFLLLVFLIASQSCTNKSKQEPLQQEIKKEWKIVEHHPAPADTVKKEIPANKQEKKVSAAKPVRRTSSSKSDDNMRGFDPASEDDMDDNGLSRFMENDDDEGWD
ncbi:MAG: hypothetical protein J6Y84_06620 [Bacteroidaceae bacterium]|nr:hypothetical protein [Bacteroidaceae bacterium]